MGLRESNGPDLSTEYEAAEKEKLEKRLQECLYIGFDLDGTLLDAPMKYYQRVATIAFRELLKELRKNIPELGELQQDTINGLVKVLKVIKSTQEIAPRVSYILKALQPNTSDEAISVQTKMFFRKLFDTEHGNTKNMRTRMRTAGPYDVDALQPLLDAGKLIFIISNAPDDIMHGYQGAIRWHTRDEVIRPQGIIFPYSLSPWEFGIDRAQTMAKPNPDLFKHAVSSMQALGLMNQNASYEEIMYRTAYIGDDSTDIRFALEAGAVGIWMNKVGEPPKGLAKLGPFLTYNNCGEIVQAILG